MTEDWSPQFSFDYLALTRKGTKKTKREKKYHRRSFLRLRGVDTRKEGPLSELLESESFGKTSARSAGE